MLQSVRVPMRFHCGELEFPASVFVFDLAQPKTMAARFDFRDDIVNKVLALRIGTKGILAVFDGGVHELVLGDHLRKHMGRTLHPIQFEELAAKVFYKATLLDCSTKYLFAETGRSYDVGVFCGSYSTRPLYRDWHMDEYAKYVSVFTLHPMSFVSPQPGLVHSWLTDERDEPITIDIVEEPWRGIA